MKHPINRFLNLFGLNLSRYKRSPYERLLPMSRYTKTTIDLLGDEFTIADGHSFYYNHREY